MIRFLRIQNLATIEDIRLDFDTGFSILTGETGSGKSIIIDSIRLVLGEKSSSDVVRTGKTEATVEAIFDLVKPPAAVKDREALQESEIVIQRQIPGEGVGKAYLRGVLVPVKKLKELSNDLVDIYGQNDHIFLLQLENHLYYLDSFSEVLLLREEVASAAQKLRRLLRQKMELKSRERERSQRLDFLNFQIEEIEKAQLTPGEEEELRAQRNILKNAEQISDLLDKALDLAYTQENSVSSLLAKLQHYLSELGPYDQAFSEMKETSNQMEITIGEIADFLIKFKEKHTASPEKLEEVEARLSLIENLKRKYGSNIEDIRFYLEKVKYEYEELTQLQVTLSGLEEEIARSFQEYQIKAGQLSEARKKGARDLEKQVEKEIALLGMKKARFQIRIETLPLSLEEPEKIRDSGTEELEFLISPNPGEQVRPLRKIASGGELSRIMLALKVIGKEKGRLKTLIFDEIDSGIGGKTAEFIAQKLRELSRHHQIICITHLPQIASFATHHYKIEKKIDRARTFTTVKKLIFEERVTEIARLMSGSRITETSLESAKEMLHHNLQNNPIEGLSASKNSSFHKPNKES
ncbi:MAG: DNA repair protein RecN [Candidatus Aminicenantales bacterium]